VKQLTGTASATTPAAPADAMALLEDIDRYPSWHPDVVKEAEVLERDADGHPTKARTKLRVEYGPLKHDFNLVMSVKVDPAGTIRLSRIPHEPTDPERFDVTWRVDDGNPSTLVRLDLAATLSVPRFVPVGGVGESMAQGLVSAATRALGSP
jgi:ribosome-associated toxin RatA of RatAB toxin-antitoxin module